MPAMVVIRRTSCYTRRVAVDKIHSVICNRVKEGHEQYLIRWQSEAQTSIPPLSWHHINELERCLEHVQDYLEERERLRKIPSHDLVPSKKRKSPDTGLDIDRRPSPFERQLKLNSQTSSASRASSVSSSVPAIASPTLDTYNGVLHQDQNGYIYCRSATGTDVVTMSITNVLTAETKRASYQSEVSMANTLIRAEYVERLKTVPGEPIKLINLYDASTPSLRFQYIPNHVLGKGVYQGTAESAAGCQQCSPRMGRDIGCEYTKKCDCLEYAAVDESRLNDKEREDYERCMTENLSTIGLPKKFPYFAGELKIQQAGALVSFYLNSRHPIYECNDNCRCGPNCRNKNVQFGRKVEVEIFKTASGRGWGLRCTQDLFRGQFIDTYRGEIITDEEASRREEASSEAAKASYLYSLDKFKDTGDLEHEPYLVDGEFMGGPTKFINHSCEPNCRQYTVSYNKHDPYVYDLAFFACRDIPAFEELTFDYLDKEEEDDTPADPGEDSIPCLCGAEKCRKWLWT